MPVERALSAIIGKTVTDIEILDDGASAVITLGELRLYVDAPTLYGPQVVWPGPVVKTDPRLKGEA